MTQLESSARIGKLAANYAGASRVFMRHKLDFCCSGNLTLREACASKGLDAESVLNEIRQLETSSDDATGWGLRPLGELIDHIVLDYHDSHREELPRLLGMAEKVARVHGERDPVRLSELAATVRALADELLVHMLKEERILFPWIRSGQPVSANGPIRVMLLEHDQAGQMLDRIRELTDDFSPPRGACATWRALYKGLEAFDEALRHHIHLENNVLFPRALERV